MLPSNTEMTTKTTVRKISVSGLIFFGNQASDFRSASQRADTSFCASCSAETSSSSNFCLAAIFSSLDVCRSSIILPACGSTLPTKLPMSNIKTFLNNLKSHSLMIQSFLSVLHCILTHHDHHLSKCLLQTICN